MYFTEDDFNKFRNELGTDVLQNVDKAIEEVISEDLEGNDVISNKTKSDNESFRLIYDSNNNKFITLFRSTGYTETIYDLFVGSSVEECINKIQELNLEKE